MPGIEVVVRGVWKFMINGDDDIVFSKIDAIEGFIIEFDNFVAQEGVSVADGFERDAGKEDGGGGIEEGVVICGGDDDVAGWIGRNVIGEGTRCIAGDGDGEFGAHGYGVCGRIEGFLIFGDFGGGEFFFVFWGRGAGSSQRRGQGE